MQRASNLNFTALLILAAALGVASGCAKHSAATTLETAVVKRGNLTQKVSATGLLGAVKSVDVGSQISGTILKLFVDFNSTVTNGQIVAQIDPAVYQANVHQSQGNLDNARAALELARANEAREKKLLENKLVSPSDYDQTIASLHQAEANVEISEAALENAQANLNYCTIYSPIDGVVISRKLDVGQTVAAAFNTPVLFTIANDLTKMNIDASVSESDIGQVKTGQTAEFTVDAFPDDVFQGNVVQVRKSPSTVDNVVTYDVIIAVDNPEQKLFPGMTADVSILVAKRTNVLVIPDAALRFIPPDDVKVDNVDDFSPTNQAASALVTAPNQHDIYVPSGAPKEPRLKLARVKVGVDDGSDSEILEGLREGDAVVTAALSKAAKSLQPSGPPPQ
ncbi:MAG: efflux RND transporter periplasmic adaptor subunit [Limisphaerales bacterium]